MLHTRFTAESPVLKVGSCHGTQLKVTGLSALSRKPNLDKPGSDVDPTFEGLMPGPKPEFHFPPNIILQSTFLLDMGLVINDHAHMRVFAAYIGIRSLGIWDFEIAW
jgi:hypothetical protein